MYAVITAKSNVFIGDVETCTTTFMQEKTESWGAECWAVGTWGQEGEASNNVLFWYKAGGVIQHLLFSSFKSVSIIFSAR